MSYLEQVTEEIKGASGAQEQPAETVSTVPENRETNETGATEVHDAPKGTVEPNEPKPPKPDLSTLSKEEKAQHAFQRQLAKQRSKYDSQIQAMHESFQKQFDDFRNEFKKSQPKEAPKTREDFENDDEYIKYLVKSQNDDYRAELDAKNAKEAEEKAAKDREQQEYMERQQAIAGTFNDNCRATFSDGEAYDAFAAKLKKGISNGLGEILDNAPAIRDYIFENPNGPAVLNEMLSSKESFVRVMRNAGSPMDAVIEMHEIAKEINGKKNAPVEQAEQKARMPKLGKPGAKSGGAKTGVFGSDHDIINFIRSR